jgi:hypothetical protein
VPATYLERQVSLKTAADSFFQKLHFKNTQEVATYSSLDHTQDGRRDIGAGQTVNVDLGGITEIKVIYLESDEELQVVIDGETTSIKPLAADQKAVMYVEGDWTSLTLINPSSTLSAQVLWLLAGN